MPRVDEQVSGRSRLPKSSRRRRRQGFTLIEAAMATVIIGVAFTAMLQLIAAGTKANSEGTELTTAINLANNIHEASVRVAYVDVFDLEGTHNPPVDARLHNISGMPGWSQIVDVSYVDENKLTMSVPDTQYEPTARITVRVQRNGQDVYRMNWLMSASQ
jgi:prepilin-type N-terminal cleavage/methylation domain-containing protein